MKESFRTFWLLPIVYVLLVCFALLDQRIGVSQNCIAHDLKNAESYYQLMRLFVMEGEWVWQGPEIEEDGAVTPPACGRFLQAAAFIAPFTTLFVLLAVISRTFSRTLARYVKTFRNGKSRTLVIGNTANALALIENIKRIAGSDQEKYPQLLILNRTEKSDPTGVRVYNFASLEKGLKKTRACERKRIISFLEDEDQQIALALALYDLCRSRSPASNTKRGLLHKLLPFLYSVPKPPQLLMHIPDASKAARIFNLGRLEWIERHLHLHHFDDSTLAARYLFSRYPLDILADLQMQNQIHLVIHGGDLFAHALAREAVYRFITAAASKLKITFVGTNADRLQEQLLNDAPALPATVAIEHRTLPTGSHFDGPVESCIPGGATIHVVGLTNEADAVAYAVRLRRLMLTHDNTLHPAPIFVRVNDDHGFGALMTHNSLPRDGVIGFGTRASIMTLEAIASERIETLAQAIHNSYRSPAQQVLRDSSDGSNQRSLSSAEYEFLSTWTQDSNRRAARHLDVKARAAGCAVSPKGPPQSCLSKELFRKRLEKRELLEKLSNMEHRRWWAERALRGVRYANVRSDVMRTHNEFVDYDELRDSKDIDAHQVTKICDYLDKTGEGLRPRLVIGIIGPGPTRLGEYGKLELVLMQIFNLVCSGLGSSAGWAPSVLSNCAPGADQVATEAANRLGMDTWALLPLPVEMYAEQIFNDAKDRCIKQGCPEQESKQRAEQEQQDFERCAASTDICVSLPTDNTSLLQLRSEAESRHRQYRRAAEHLIACSDLVIAIYNEQEMAGSLTEEMITYRHSQRGEWRQSSFFPSPGTSLLIIDPQNPRVEEDALRVILESVLEFSHTA